jgi:hypothetical protein
MFVKQFTNFEDFILKRMFLIILKLIFIPSQNWFFEKHVVKSFNISENVTISVKLPKYSGVS